MRFFGKNGKIVEVDELSGEPIPIVKKMGRCLLNVIDLDVNYLRRDTKAIISINTSRVSVMREVVEYDEEGDEITNITKKIIAEEKVRIASISSTVPQGLKPTDSTLQYYNSYNLTAKFDSEIIQGDILIREDGKKFIVQYVEKLYLKETTKNYCYRTVGTLGLLS